MASKEANPKQVDTIVGTNTTVRGTIEAEGTLRIDGRFEGDITAAGDLWIGESGFVQGTVAAKNITVAGQLQGKIEARGRLELLPTANVQGEIIVQPLALSGVFRKGNPTAIRPINLTTRGRKNLKIKKVEEDTGLFTVNVVTAKKGEHYQVELGLREDAKTGRFRGTLKMYTNHRDQGVIEVPLSGVIQE